MQYEENNHFCTSVPIPATSRGFTDGLILGHPWNVHLSL